MAYLYGGNKEKYYIYGLYCPIEKDIKYIGITTRPWERKLQHQRFHDATKGKKEWLSDLKKRNLSPIFIILDEANNRISAELIESILIRFVNNHINILLNIQGK